MSDLTKKIETLADLLDSAKHWREVTLEDLNGFEARVQSILADVNELETRLDASRHMVEHNAKLAGKAETVRSESYALGRKAGIASVAATQAVNIAVVRQAKREAYEHALALIGDNGIGGMLDLEAAIDALNEEESGI